MTNPKSNDPNPQPARRPQPGRAAGVSLPAAAQSARQAAAVRARPTGWHPQHWRRGAGLLSLLAGVAAAHAQLAVPWHTMDGGGGTSTGGVFRVSGTIGQPDAGPSMSGGGFSVAGGFWSMVIAVQMPGAPPLSVFRTATNTVVVSWPLAGAEGWVLEATNALPNLPVAWPQIPPLYQTNGPNLQFIEPAPVGKKFYRLHKP